MVFRKVYLILQNPSSTSSSVSVMSLLSFHFEPLSPSITSQSSASGTSALLNTRFYTLLNTYSRKLATKVFYKKVAKEPYTYWNSSEKLFKPVLCLICRTIFLLILFGILGQSIFDAAYWQIYGQNSIRINMCKKRL